MPNSNRAIIKIANFFTDSYGWEELNTNCHTKLDTSFTPICHFYQVWEKYFYFYQVWKFGRSIALSII